MSMFGRNITVNADVNVDVDDVLNQMDVDDILDYLNENGNQYKDCNECQPFTFDTEFYEKLKWAYFHGDFDLKKFMDMIN